MSTVHAPDDKLVHSCDTCGRKFPHLFRLRMHEKTHLAYDKVQLELSLKHRGRASIKIQKGIILAEGTRLPVVRSRGEEVFHREPPQEPPEAGARGRRRFCQLRHGAVAAFQGGEGVSPRQRRGTHLNISGNRHRRPRNNGRRGNSNILCATDRICNPR